MSDRAAVRLATVGKLGRFPIAPGTAGSALGIVIVALLGRLPLEPKTLAATLGGLTVALYCAGAWAAGGAERFFNTVDPGIVIIDEVVGQMVVFLWRPASGWLWLTAGFVLFRFFDVIKPFPARRSERLRGGWGVMTDDVVAGAYAAAALFLLGFALR